MATRLNVTESGRLPLSYPPRAGFEAQLTNSVIPTSSMGAITYTRATIAKVKDNEGVIRNCISGEVRFEGARRVQNLATYSQDFTNAIWAKGNLTVGAFTDTIGSIPTYTLTDDATSASHSLRYNTSFIIGNTYCYSAHVKAGTSSYCQFAVASISTNYANFDLSNGTITDGNTSQATITPVSGATEWYRISLYFTATITSTQYGGLFMITAPTSARAQTYVGSGSTIRVAAFQIEDVTGQSIQTASEYVSTNVLSSPYHGAYVDGVKYFDTTLTGAAISPSTLKGVVIEGARTNSFLQSESMVTSWTRSGATAVASPIAVPTGMLSGCKLIPDAGTQVSQTYQSITTSATNYTFSVYAKAGEFGVIQLRTHGSISGGYVNFDLTNGTLNAPGTWTGMIEALSGGWYRCIAMTETVLAATNNVVINVVSSLTSAHTEAVTGDGTSGLYLWQAQWESGTFASSPITTAAASTTRNADALSYNVSNVVSAKGAAYLEFTMGYVPPVGFDRRTLALSGNTNNRFQLIATSTTNNRTAILVGNGSSVMGTDLAIAMSTGSYSKVAGKWVNSSVANLFQNGSKSTDLASPVIAVTQIDVGTAGGNAIFGYVKNLKVWKSPPTDSELQDLTTL